jgi:CHAD domain-containing protein
VSYRIEPDESIREGVRRIAREQIVAAREDVRGGDAREAVHEVRKRCKKLRALLRLVRLGMPEVYRRENARLRDAARELSGLRDASSQIEGFDALMRRLEGEVDPHDHAPVRAALEERRQKLEAELGVGVRLERMDEALKRARERVSGWDFDADAPKLVARSVEKTYGRALDAMRASRRDPSAENLHEWRKRVKYGRHHMRLLAGAFDPVLPALSDASHALSNRLGEHRDLVLLRRTLVAEPDRFAPAPGSQTLLDLIDARCLGLRTRAMPLGLRLYADPPKRFRKRVKRYLRAWEDERQMSGGAGGGS